MKLQSPTGKDIIGTQERIPGVAGFVNEDIQMVDGEYDIDYEGSTDMDWDRQETERQLCQRVFVDEDGTLWLERELKLVEEEK